MRSNHHKMYNVFQYQKQLDAVEMRRSIEQKEEEVARKLKGMFKVEHQSPC